MHLFLQGKRGVGKSTVIREALEIIFADRVLTIGGFFTWNGGRGDPNVYMKPARQSASGEIHRLAAWDDKSKRMMCDVPVFEREGVRLLTETADSDLIVMDELGYLESDAVLFKETVMNTLAGSTPVLGVLRLGDVPWHEAIKCDYRVKLIDVNVKNRDSLPKELALLITKNII